MVFIQLLVNNTNNNTYIDVPCYGIYDLNVVGLQFHDTGGNQFRLLQVQSDVLRFPYSNQQSLVFMNNAQNTINYCNGRDDMPCIRNIDMNGKILINVALLAGHALNGTWHLILTLEVNDSNKAK